MKLNDILNSKMNLLHVVLLFIGLFLSSCSSNYIILKNDICRNGAVWNTSKTKVAFVTIQQAYTRPTGIFKFPDGGRPDVYYSNLVLYIFDIKTNRLESLTNFKKLCYTIARDNYYIDLAFDSEYVYYKIDLIGWDTHIDEKTKNKYKNKYFAINLKTKQIQEISSSLFFSKYKKETISSTKINKILNHIVCDKWGMNLQNIYAQSKDKYIDYLIYGKMNNFTYDCIFSQIVPSLTKTDIKYIVKEMNKHKQELFTEYKSYSKNDVYQKSLKLDEYNQYNNYIDKTIKRFKNVH